MILIEARIKFCGQLGTEIFFGKILKILTSLLSKRLVFLETFWQFENGKILRNWNKRNVH